MKPRRRRGAVTAPDRPEVVAHRGASSTVAEHTLAAYVSAIEAGAQGLECDVRLTRDGHLVCVHDRTVNRTSDGKGVVSDLSLAGLEALDFTSWHSELPRTADELLGDSPYLAGVTPDLGEDGRVLTLERLLELVADAGRPVRLLVETKHPTRYGGLVEKELVELLAHFGLAGRPGPAGVAARAGGHGSPVVDHELRTDGAAPDPAARPGHPDRAADGASPTRPARGHAADRACRSPGPDWSCCRPIPASSPRAHARGHRVFVWTVNERDEVDFVRAARSRHDHHRPAGGGARAGAMPDRSRP